MKFIIVIAAALAVASAQFNRNLFPSSTPFPYVTSPQPQRLPVVNRVVNNDQFATVVREESDSNPDGSFIYSFDTDNGISVAAKGTPRDFGGNPPVVPVVIQGRYSFTTPEGKVVTIEYIADENGYQAQGDALPTPPPISAAIIRSLEFNARNAPPAQKK